MPGATHVRTPEFCALVRRLHDVDGLSFSEIGRRTGVSTATVSIAYKKGPDRKFSAQIERRRLALLDLRQRIDQEIEKLEQEK